MMETRVFKAFCGRMDHGGCGVLVEIEEGRIVGIKGDPACPTNYGKLCPKGMAAIERIYHPDRLTFPMVRTGDRGGGGWREISWDEALNTIAARIKAYEKEFGPHSILFAEGAPRGLEYLFMYRLAAALGTPNVATTGAVYFAPRWGAALLTCGFYPKPDIKHSECIVVWGSNVLDTSADGRPGFQLRRVENKGVPLIVIDPRKTAITAKADLWLRTRPGSYGALALGMLHVIAKDGLYDEPFVTKWVTGFPQLSEHLERYTPETVSAMTWVPADQIEKAARMHAVSKPAAILWGNTLDHNNDSVQASRAVVALMAITGNLDVSGGNVDASGLMLRHPGEFVLGERFTKLKDDMIGAEYPMAKMLGFVPSKATVNAMLTDDPYPVKLMFVHTSNPLASYANSQKVFLVLNRVDFLVVSDVFMTPTAALADMVLPAATNYEFNDLGHYGPPWGSVHARPKLVEPQGQCWSDIKILNELAKRVGLEEYFWKELDECLNYLLEPSGLDFEAFKDALILEVGQERKKFERRGFRTRSGKIELYSGLMEKWGFSPLPRCGDPVLRSSEYPYLLTSAKDLPFFHTSLRNIRSSRKLAPTPKCCVHPELAGAVGLQEVNWALIENETGQIKQRVKLDESIDARVVYSDYGWWFPEKGNQELYGWEESNVNILINDDWPPEPVIGENALRTVPCNIRRSQEIHERA